MAKKEPITPFECLESFSTYIDGELQSFSAGQSYPDRPIKADDLENMRAKGLITMEKPE